MDGAAPAVVQAIYGPGRLVDEHYDGCAYCVEQMDDAAMENARRKIEAIGGSVRLVLRRLPEQA